MVEEAPKAAPGALGAVSPLPEVPQLQSTVPSLHKVGTVARGAHLEGGERGKKGPLLGKVLPQPRLCWHYPHKLPPSRCTDRMEFDAFCLSLKAAAGPRHAPSFPCFGKTPQNPSRTAGEFRSDSLFTQPLKSESFFFLVWEIHRQTVVRSQIYPTSLTQPQVRTAVSPSGVSPRAPWII